MIITEYEYRFCLKGTNPHPLHDAHPLHAARKREHMDALRGAAATFLFPLFSPMNAGAYQPPFVGTWGECWIGEGSGGVCPYSSHVGWDEMDLRGPARREWELPGKLPRRWRGWFSFHFRVLI